MLRKMKSLGNVRKRFYILFRLAVFTVTNLGLSITQPPPKKFLVKRLTIDCTMSGVKAIRFEDPAYVLTCKSSPELVGLKEFISEMRRRCAELIPLLPVAFAAETR